MKGKKRKKKENFKLKDERIIRRNVKFYILSSSSAGVVQFWVLGKLGIRLVFWGGLLRWLSGVCLDGVAPPLSRGPGSV